MPDDGLEPSIFISFATDDARFVLGLVAQLDEWGFKAWYYLEGMKAGDRIFRTLMQEIAAASAVMVVVSRASAQSQYVEREIDFALQHGKPIIPILLNEPNDDAPLNFFLRGIHRIDARGGRDYTPDLQRALNIPPQQQHLDNLRREDSLRGAETTEISVCSGNPSTSHFESSALPLPLSLWRQFRLFFGKRRVVALVVLSWVLIGWISWNRPLRNVPEAIWMLLSSGPPRIPLSINKSLAINQPLSYYGDRANNETGKRFDEELSNRFRLDTGIKVEVTNPTQEERLEKLKRELARSSPAYDVIMIDIIWVGELAEYLTDLTEYFDKKEIDKHRDKIITNNTVDGKLFAIPWFEDFGLLYYRKDLVKQKDVPETWEQLETIAARIQQEQRSKSKENSEFIGFAWQGAFYEGLICNTLEWIASRGGYNTNTNHIHDSQIVVDALDRARAWLERSGAISEEVYRDMEEESLDRFHRGKAAFLRMWSSAYAKLKQTDVSFDVAPLPHAKDRKSVSMVGGWQLAIPKNSRHPHAAAEFIRYLTSPEVQTWRALQGSYLPTIDTVATKSEVQRQLSSLYIAIEEAERITRPSTRLGRNYEEASICFREVIYSALFAKSKDEVKSLISGMAQKPNCQEFLLQPQ